MRFLRSAQVGGSDIVHVVKLHVLAAHGPDKGVIRRAYAAVDAPGGVQLGQPQIIRVMNDHGVYIRSYSKRLCCRFHIYKIRKL